MDITTLRSWLTRHSADIYAFTDYEPIYDSGEYLHDNLGTFWFRDSNWNPAGYRFASLGQDNSGGQVCLWLERGPGTPSPVVFFGSEGGAGVLAPSTVAFLQALACGAIVNEYRRENSNTPSYLSFEDNWFLSGDTPRNEAARQALGRFRASVEEEFGPLPPFEVLVSVPDEMQSEFYGWVTSIQNRVAERERQAEIDANDLKHQDRRNKASRYAASSSTSLPSTASTLLEGSTYQGKCGACGKAGDVRLTRYDEFTFGICASCYFSNAW